jgi:hypothetical protein
MNQMTRTAAALAALGLALATTACGQAESSPLAPQAQRADASVSAAQAEQLADAMLLHQRGRWSAAYGRFMKLADAGNADAARIALTMARYGSDLYRTAWDVSTQQEQAWEQLARRGADVAASSTAE